MSIVLASLGLRVDIGKGSRVLFFSGIQDGAIQRQVSGEQQVPFPKLLKGISRGLFKANILECVWDLAFLRCDQVFGAQDKTRIMMNFLASSLKWEHSFFGLLSGKIWNVSQWGLAEKHQRWSLSEIKSLHLPSFRITWDISSCMVADGSYQLSVVI